MRARGILRLGVVSLALFPAVGDGLPSPREQQPPPAVLCLFLGGTAEQCLGHLAAGQSLSSAESSSAWLATTLKSRSSWTSTWDPSVRATSPS